jgi:hypothetical protein
MPRLQLRSLLSRRGLLALGAFATISCAGALVTGLDVLPSPPPAAPPEPARFERRIDVAIFQKGNLHAHSNWSDGDSSPAEVYRWYRNHGYHFAVLSDHHQRVDPRVFAWLERSDFVLVPGEEITLTIKTKPVHVNALCTRQTIGPKSFEDRRAGLAWAVEQVNQQGGVALINHPNFAWALDLEDLAATPGARMVEIMNGHAHVPWRGNASHPSQEALWTTLLDRGYDFAAAAVDDAHRFREDSGAPNARPGTGWVQVFAREPSVPAICEALARGDLYASNGPSIARLVIDDQRFEVWPADRSARVEFVGEGGALLAAIEADERGVATYELRGDERYVRARVLDGAGHTAWTQAYRVVQGRP